MMGSASSIAPFKSDHRIEKMMRSPFFLPANKVQTLWILYCTHDKDLKGTVHFEDFIISIIKCESNLLTNSMFKLIDAEDDREIIITFGEFVEIITTFACFETQELLKYFFYVLDFKKTGNVEIVELKHFFESLWNEQSSAALRNTLHWLQGFNEDEGGFIEFRHLRALHLKYPMVFYPLYMLQVNIIQNTLGETWWNEHKAFIKEQQSKKNEIALQARKKQDEDMEQENEIVSEEMILKRMGYIQYHFMPWLREVEKKRITRIFELENTLK